MALGLCCHFLVPSRGRGYEDTGYENSLSISVLQLGRWRTGKYTREVVEATYTRNLQTLIDGLPRVIKAGYKSFRFPSGIFPLFDQVPQDWWDNELTCSLLQRLGSIILSADVRATFHPGQFCSLSSDDPTVHENSVRELNHHAWIFDQMRLPQTPYYAINVHGGKGDRHDNLVYAINASSNVQPHRRLTDGARNRLTLENDETCYTTAELLSVSRETGVPVVWDSHHHTLNPGGLDESTAARAAAATWGTIKPLQHISNSEEGITENHAIQKRRAHSKLIRYVPPTQLSMMLANEVDVDVESKTKNLAIDKMIKDFGLSLA